MNSTSSPKNGLLGVLGVVLLGGRAVKRAQLERDKGEALALQPGDDLAHQAPANAIGFDQDQGALGGHA